MGLQRSKHYNPVLTPRFINGVVVTRIPEGTPEPEKARVLAIAKQMAYDHSEHPDEWYKDYYYRRRPHGNQNRLKF